MWYTCLLFIMLIHKPTTEYWCYLCWAWCWMIHFDPLILCPSLSERMWSNSPKLCDSLERVVSLSHARIPDLLCLWSLVCSIQTACNLNNLMLWQDIHLARLTNTQADYALVDFYEDLWSPWFKHDKKVIIIENRNILTLWTSVSVKLFVTILIWRKKLQCWNLFRFVEICHKVQSLALIQ